MEEQEFQNLAEDALNKLYRELLNASDDYGYEADRSAGTITVEFDEPPAKFVVSPNSPVRQIWISALSKSYKLDWDEVEQAFVLSGTGQTLKEVMEQAIAKQVGEDVVEL